MRAAPYASLVFALVAGAAGKAHAQAAPHRVFAVQKDDPHPGVAVHLE